MLLAAAVLLGTFFLVSGYDHWQQSLAQQWFRRGQNDFARRDASAVADFRTALFYAPGDEQVRYRLAQSLEAEHRTAEAKSYFLALWRADPENAVYNLALAQMAVAADNVSDAVRYFHGAIYGIWPDSGRENSLGARFALVRFLLSVKANSQAQAELVGLAAELPADRSLILEAGQLAMDAGANDQALGFYRRALSLSVNDAQAAAGAGFAAFQLSRYGTAARWLRVAMRHHDLEPRVTEALREVDAALNLDPYEPHISYAAREQRAGALLTAAAARLTQCAQPNTPTPLAETYQRLKRSDNPRGFRLDPGLTDEITDFAQRVESQSFPGCAPPNQTDHALALVSAKRGDLAQ